MRLGIPPLNIKILLGWTLWIQNPSSEIGRSDVRLVFLKAASNNDDARSERRAKLQPQTPQTPRPLLPLTQSFVHVQPVLQVISQRLGGITCLIRPHLIYVFFVASRTIIIRYVIRHFWRRHVRQVVLDEWFPLKRSVLSCLVADCPRPIANAKPTPEFLAHRARLAKSSSLQLTRHSWHEWPCPNQLLVLNVDGQSSIVNSLVRSHWHLFEGTGSGKRKLPLRVFGFVRNELVQDSPVYICERSSYRESWYGDWP